MTLFELTSRVPLIAVLRGITPAETKAVGQVLIDAGFCCLEVPFNSPNPEESIAILAKHFSDRALIGAGTVMQISHIDRARAAGAKLIVMPHCDRSLIVESKKQGLICLPGVLTPTEAFQALGAGADALKIFPAVVARPEGIKALRSVLPKDTLIFPTGGIDLTNATSFMQAGAAGLGLGGELFRPGDSIAQITEKANHFVQVIKK